MRKSAMRSLAIAVLIAALATWAPAQRGAASGAHFSGSHAAPPFAGSRRFASSRAGRGFYRDRYAPYSSLSLPFPFFDDANDSGDIYSTGYPVAAPLPPYLPPPRDYTVGPQDSSTEPTQPLLIELQNGRYIQTSVTAINGQALPLDSQMNDAQMNDSPMNDAQANDVGASADRSPRAAAHPAPPANNIAPVVLIFRDGHSEQIRDYTIADGTLYAQGDFYTDGYWNKQIALATLDIPKTRQTNSAQGVNFTLPSSPNEVITRF